MRSVKEAIGQAKCNEKTRRQLERFYRMIYVEFPWLWAIRQSWNLGWLSTMPLVRGSKSPDLKACLCDNFSRLQTEMWLVVGWGLIARAIKVDPLLGEPWAASAYHTLATTYGSGSVQILYVVFVQGGIGGQSGQFTIYRGPTLGWKWAVGESLFGFNKSTLQ